MSPIGIIYSEYDMDSGYVYAKFITGDIVLIDCDEIEKTYANNMYERSELDYLIYNDPAAYVELILDNEVEKYLKKSNPVRSAEFPALNADRRSWPAGQERFLHIPFT